MRCYDIYHIGLICQSFMSLLTFLLFCKCCMLFSLQDCQSSWASLMWRTLFAEVTHEHHSWIPRLVPQNLCCMTFCRGFSLLHIQTWKIKIPWWDCGNIIIWDMMNVSTKLRPPADITAPQLLFLLWWMHWLSKLIWIINLGDEQLIKVIYVVNLHVFKS